MPTKPEIVRMSELPRKKEEKMKVVVMDKKLKRKLKHGEEEDISAIEREEEIPELEEPSEESGGTPTAPISIISSDTLAAAIASDFGTTCKGGAVYLSDGKYKVYPDADIRTVLGADLTDSEAYVAQYFDCDDFAQVVSGAVNHKLKGVPFGILWFRGQGVFHAVNCYYSSSGKMKVVEPQTDHVYSFDKSKYCPMLVVI